MMSYAGLLNEYIQKSGLSIGEIARKVNASGVKIDKSYISKLKNEDSNPPSDEISLALAEVTGGDPDKLIWAAMIDKSHPSVKPTLMMVDKLIMRQAAELQKKYPIPDNLTDEEIEDFTESIPEYREFVEKLGKEMVRLDATENKGNTIVREEPAEYDVGLRRIPLLGSIAAGQAIDRIEYIEGYELVEDNLLRGRKAFALKVKGNSMIGDCIHEGDVVIVVVQEEVASSDIAVVAVDNDTATLKRVKVQNDMCILTPSNSAMEPMLHPAKDIHIIGKVIQVRKNLD